MAEPKQSRVEHWRDERRRKKEAKGDSPERQAEHHAPKRGIVERVIHASPGGQRHTGHKGDHR
jgi:hypothetical protein